MLDIGEAARDASRKLAVLTSRRKNSILKAMAEELEARKADILEANKTDLAAAEANDISGAMLDRLELTDARFASMIKGNSERSPFYFVRLVNRPANGHIMAVYRS